VIYLLSAYHGKSKLTVPGRDFSHKDSLNGRPFRPPSVDTLFPHKFPEHTTRDPVWNNLRTPGTSMLGTLGTWKRLCNMQEWRDRTTSRLRVLCGEEIGGEGLGSGEPTNGYLTHFYVVVSTCFIADPVTVLALPSQAAALRTCTSNNQPWFDPTTANQRICQFSLL